MIDLNGKELFKQSSNNNTKKNQQLQLNELAKGMSQIHELQLKTSEVISGLALRIGELEKRIEDIDNFGDE